jgi:hypothetical protein
MYGVDDRAGPSSNEIMKLFPSDRLVNMGWPGAFPPGENETSRSRMTPRIRFLPICPQRQDVLIRDFIRIL